MNSGALHNILQPFVTNEVAVASHRENKHRIPIL